MAARQERRALLPHQTPLSASPARTPCGAYPRCRRLSFVYCRRLTQDSEKLPTKLPVVSDGKMMREVKTRSKRLPPPEAAKWAALVAASVAPVRSNVEPLHFPPKYSTKLSSPVPVAGS